MTATQVASVLRTLGALRIAAGQEFRGQCIKATANEILKLSPAELAMVGLTSEVSHA